MLVGRNEWSPGVSDSYEPACGSSGGISLKFMKFIFMASYQCHILFSSILYQGKFISFTLLVIGRVSFISPPSAKLIPFPCIITFILALLAIRMYMQFKIYKQRINNLRELSNIWVGGGGLKWGGTKYFGELVGSVQKFRKFIGGGYKNVLKYSTSNMGVNTMAWLHNWGEPWKIFLIFFWGGGIFTITNISDPLPRL